MYIKFFYDPFSFKPSERMRQYIFTLIDHELDHANYFTSLSKEELERQHEEQRPFMESFDKSIGMADSQALERALLSEMEKRAHVYSLDAQAKREGRGFAEVLEEFLKMSLGQEAGLSPMMKRVKDAYLAYHAEKFPSSKVANWIRSVLKFCAS